AAPIKQKPYCIPPDKQEFLQQEIEKMKELGVIRPSTGPWSSSIIIVPKKNGKKRLCVDYCKLNAVIKKDIYPLPNINNVLDSFRKAIWFFSFDLASGYWT
ncbi:12837_t:CDS:1, partial [Racocetra persica]